jgi:molybdopterin converting factor subunit 1
MKIPVKFFAVAKELTGEDSVLLDLPDGLTSDDLLDALVARYPLMEPWKPYLRIAVNREYSAAGIILREGDEAAVIPPVSGG